jgi:excisionase family DNA binding protein
MEAVSNETNTEVQPVNDELLTVHEVARRLRVDDTTVRRWINNGILEAITLPHSGKRRGYRVKQSTLNVLLQAPALPA